MDVETFLLAEKKCPYVLILLSFNNRAGNSAADPALSDRLRGNECQAASLQTRWYRELSSLCCNGERLFYCVNRQNKANQERGHQRMKELSSSQVRQMYLDFSNQKGIRSNRVHH